MAIKPKSKKPEVKKPAAKAKPAPRAEKNGKTRNGLVVELLLERKYSDQQIRDKVNKSFSPLELNPVAITVARARLNEALSSGQQIERLVEVDGKVIPKSKAPKTGKASKKRKPVDPKNDRLAKVGIKVKAKPKAAPKAAPEEAPTPA